MSGKYEDAFIIISVTIPVNCQKLIDGLMPQIKDMERTLYGTYHRNIIEYSTSRIKTPESIVVSFCNS